MKYIGFRGCAGFFLEGFAIIGNAGETKAEMEKAKGQIKGEMEEAKGEGSKKLKKEESEG